MINILQLQAKDLVDSTYKVSYKKKRKATLDYSLETIELNKISKKFTFNKNNKLYSNDMVSVGFKYSLKDEDGNITINTSQLRTELYTNGFSLDFNGTIKHYVRYKRSSGSSRVGKCLFINVKLYDKMMKWTKCGLKITDGMALDLASYESYISLTLSSIVDTVNIDNKEILVIEDRMFNVKDKAMNVTLGADNQLVAKHEDIEITNNIWDGQSLIDSTIFARAGIVDKGMMLLRNKMFKSAGFNTNIQEFFNANDITEVKDMFGNTHNAKDIKVITTPSSIKFLKFGNYSTWLKNIDNNFGIVKTEKKTSFEDGNKVNSHYQLINTLPLTEDEIKQLIQPSLDYIYSVKTDTDALKQHVGLGSDSEYYDDSFDVASRNQMAMYMLNNHEDFIYTKEFKSFINDLCTSMQKELKRGHVLINGNYSTIVGNPMDMLNYAIGIEPQASKDKELYIYNNRFNNGSELLAIRSPHVTMGNVVKVVNRHDSDVDRWFNFTNEIVVVDSSNYNLLEALNGADFDSDALMLTDNSILLNAKKRMGNYAIPTNNVDSTKKERFYTIADLGDLDHKTSINKIGQIINLSQLLNSLYWSNDFNSELYEDICKLAVLSNIEIDRAKKEYVVSSIQVLGSLSNKWSKGLKKPLFFKQVQIDNGYDIDADTRKYNKEVKEDTGEIIDFESAYEKYDTPMDYLVTNIKVKQKKKNNKTIKLLDIVGKKITLKDADRHRVKKAIQVIVDLKTNNDAIFGDEVSTGKEKHLTYTTYKEYSVEQFKKINLTETDIYKILKDASSSKHYSKSLSAIALSMLIECHKQNTTKLFKK